jgi:hypothetical protein
MVDKKFNELSVDARFFVNGVEYIKTETVRISCCKSINAQEANNTAVKSFFTEDSTVQVNA